MSEPVKRTITIKLTATDDYNHDGSEFMMEISNDTPFSSPEDVNKSLLAALLDRMLRAVEADKWQAIQQDSMRLVQ